MERLTALPRRNNDQYIASYIQEQRQYLKVYAANGQSDRISWDTSTANAVPASALCSTLRPEIKDDITFGTPILRARNEGKTEPKALEDRGNRGQQSAELADIPSRSRASPPVMVKGVHPKETVDIHSKRARSRKDTAHEDSSGSEARETRLAERRRRKKLKKDIMKPDVKNSSKKKKSSNNKKKETGAQVGFALMHGFSATNVGKNRLTLDHLIANRRNGVFKKGKASDATKILPKDSPHFIESQFLNAKLKPTALTCSHSPSGSSSSGSQLSSTRTVKDVVGESIRKQDHKISGKGQRKSAVSEEPLVSSSSRDRTVRSKYNPDDSIIWDIEQSSNLSEARKSSEHVRGTILVDLPQTINSRLKLASRHVVNATVKFPDPLARSLADTVGNCQPDSSGSTLSLGPSQSASQLVVETLPCPNRSSRYFHSTAKTLPRSPDKISSSADPAVSPPLNVYGAQTSVQGIQPDQHLSGSAMGRDFVLFHEYYPTACLTEPRLSGLGFDGQSQELEGYPEIHGEYYWSEIDRAELEVLENCTYSEYDQCSSEMIVAEDVLAPISGTPLTSWASDLISQRPWDEHCTHTIGYEVPQFYDGSTGLENVYDALTQEPGSQTPGSLQDQWEQCHLGQPECYTTDSGQNEDLMDMVYDDLSCQDNASESEVSSISCNPDDEESELATTKFYQGRVLLQGLAVFPSQPRGLNGLVAVEAEVAGLLRRTHWLPQKF